MSATSQLMSDIQNGFTNFANGGVTTQYTTTTEYIQPSYGGYQGQHARVLNNEFENTFPNRTDNLLNNIVSNPRFQNQHRNELMETYHRAARNLVREYAHFKTPEFLNQRINMLQQAGFDFRQYPDIYQSATPEAKAILQSRGIY